MTHATSISLLRSEFDDFLFARIGEDTNEMPLSVLSALARLDVNPWQEAAQLTRSPAETATQRLALLIVALPDGLSVDLEPGTIAARLIGLLPRRAGSNIPSRETLLGVVAATNSRAVIAFVFFMALVLSAQCIIASRQSPAQADNAYAPASSAVFPKIPPPNSGR